MAFWVRNTSGGTYTIDDIGCTLLLLEERDLHLSTVYEALQDSTDLATALAAADITRLDGPGGSIIPAADAFDDATAIHMVGGAAHTSSTLAEVNALVSDANLDDDGDPRDPNAHASTHKGDGGDAIADATPTVAGLLSTSDKDKLDGIDDNATNTPLTDTAPVNVTKAAASAGVATDASRQDHKHDVGTAAPAAGAVAVGNTTSEGTGTSLARADHVHTVTGGSPVSVGTALVDGTATTFARADHVHTGLTRGDGDLNSFPAKALPIGADVLLIEDSAATFEKKKATIQQIRDGMSGLPLQTAYVGLASNVSTNSLYNSGLGYMNMPTMSTTLVTTKASSILRLELTCCYSNSTAKNVFFRILVDGARTKGTAGSSSFVAMQATALTFHQTVSAGSHPVIVQWCVGGGTANCNPVGVLGTMADYHHCSLLVQELA